MYDPDHALTKNNNDRPRLGYHAQLADYVLNLSTVYFHPLHKIRKDPKFANRALWLIWGG